MWSLVWSKVLLGWFFDPFRCSLGFCVICWALVFVYQLWNCYITLHPVISEFYSTRLKSEVRRSSPETLFGNSILYLCTMLLTTVVHPVFGGDVTKLLNLLKSEIDFSTLYTNINLMDLRACMKVLIKKVLRWVFKLYCLKFLLVQRTALNLRCLWLKNEQEISPFETLHGFKIVEGSNLISSLEFLLDNLFLCFGHRAYRQWYPHGYQLCCLYS